MWIIDVWIRAPASSCCCFLLEITQFLCASQLQTDIQPCLVRRAHGNHYFCLGIVLRVGIIYWGVLELRLGLVMIAKL